jgi:hypothetical protein
MRRVYINFSSVLYICMYVEQVLWITLYDVQVDVSTPIKRGKLITTKAASDEYSYE